MFTYRPLDVTSHLIVSVSVLRWRKCYASRSCMFVCSALYQILHLLLLLLLSSSDFSLLSFSWEIFTYPGM